MFKKVSAFLDGQGDLHPTQKLAEQADFRVLLKASFKGQLSIDQLVDRMDDLDKILKEAKREAGPELMRVRGIDFEIAGESGSEAVVPLRKAG